EAIEVEVVERRLDLVEDVEGTRAREEHREQERERGQRLLAAGEQGQAFGRLAGRRDLDLHPLPPLFAVCALPSPLVPRVGLLALRALLEPLLLGPRTRGGSQRLSAEHPAR